MSAVAGLNPSGRVTPIACVNLSLINDQHLLDNIVFINLRKMTHVVNVPEEVKVW